MTEFDLDGFIRAFVTRRPDNLLAADLRARDADLRARLEGRRVLVVGGAGTIGSHYVKSVLRYPVAGVTVVDINENDLTELVRDVRSSALRVPDDFTTYPIDLGSGTFARLLAAKGPFDIVANFAARKHVRSEKDVFSIAAMCDVNVFMARRLLDALAERPPEAFFCVSTDKAANPVNVMGATKKLMEEAILAFAGRLPVKTARFANVAFSNGSLPRGWLNRLARRQPLSCPLGIRRFFVSPDESGDLCLMASILGDAGDIFYPKLDPVRDMVPFDAVVRDLLRETGLGCRPCATSADAKAAMADLSGGWPCEFFASDTSGEKAFEEFTTARDETDETRFAALGVIKNAPRRPLAEIDAILDALRATLLRPDATKADVVAALGEYLPDFHHIEKGRGLDSRM